MGVVIEESLEPIQRRSGVGRAVGIVIMMVVLLGCSEVVRDLEGAGVKEFLDLRTVAEIDALGVEIDGDLDCSSDVDDDEVVVGTCTGSTTDGRSVLTTLDGSIEEGKCSGQITITVGDEVVYDESGVDCLAESEE